MKMVVMYTVCRRLCMEMVLYGDGFIWRWFYMEMVVMYL